MISPSKIVLIAVIAFLIGAITGISIYGALRALAIQGVLIGFVIVAILLAVTLLKR